MLPPPSSFGPSFLSWFQTETETSWGAQTRWAGGLSDAELKEAQSWLGVPFPSDFALFLKTLHTTTTPKGFHDWKNGRGAIDAALGKAADAVIAEVESRSLWLAEWGTKSLAPSARADHVRRLLQGSSPLIPLCGNRYLVGAPTEPGNPVLSISGHEVTFFARSLRDALLRECRELFDANLVPPNPPVDDHARSVRLWGWFLGG